MKITFSVKDEHGTTTLLTTSLELPGIFEVGFYQLERKIDDGDGGVQTVTESFTFIPDDKVFLTDTDNSYLLDGDSAFMTEAA